MKGLYVFFTVTSYRKVYLFSKEIIVRSQLESILQFIDIFFDIREIIDRPIPTP